MKIAIIGAGPRGILTTKYLIKNFKNDSINPLEINLFDPYPIGGRVWRTNQSLHLIMNTTAKDTSIFENCRMGPSLDQWARTEAPDFILNGKHKFPTEGNNNSYNYKNKVKLASIASKLMPDDYPPRALYGIYLQWCFKRMVSKRFLTKEIKVNVHANQIINIKKQKNKFILIGDQKQQINSFDKVVFNIGLSENYPNPKQISLQKYANQKQLHYILPGYPSNENLNHIKPKDNVIIRGLGLSFFDYVTRLTEDRGGQFQMKADHTLRYNRSGKEPHIYAGSRRGMPYYPKAYDQKKHNEKYIPHFLTVENIKKHLKNGHLAYQDFINFLKNDIEFVFYTRLIQEKYPKLDLKHFQNEFIDNPNKALQKAKFAKNKQLNWKHVLNPVAGVKITTIDDYQRTIINRLQVLINDAKKGSKTDPLLSALSTIIDFENMIRWIVKHRLFTVDEYQNKFLKQFNSTSRFLAMGPPLIRIQQLKALIKAHIITIIPPQMHIAGANGQFKAVSFFYPKNIFSANNLIEARLPKIDLNNSENLILTNLKNKGLNSSYTHDDNQDPNFYKWGNIDEDKQDWLTTVSPKNQEHDDSKIIANHIAQNILKK